MAKNGMIVNLYVSDYPRPLKFGASGGHAFAGKKSLTVVGIYENGKLRDLPENAQVFEPSEERPAAILVVRHLGNERVLSIAPVDYDKRHYMAGGALADGSDSRFRDLVGFYGGITVHDRYEG